MFYPDREQVLGLHAHALLQDGGRPGCRDAGLVESAVAQPWHAFVEQPLYPTVVDKAAALGFSLIANHAFVDGNKRVGFAALDVFLRLNGLKVAAGVDEVEAVILAVASGRMTRDRFTDWVRGRVAPV